MRTRRVKSTALTIVMAVLCAVWIYPFAWMLGGSFKSNTELLAGGLSLFTDEPQIANYTRAWNVANFSQYFLNTVIVSVATVLIVVILSCLTGYALGRINFPGRRVVLLAVVAMLFVPKGYTIIPLYQLINTLGLADSLAGVIVAEASGAHVLFILLFTSYFRKLPAELEDAAAIDGCGLIATFWKVYLPMAKPPIATCAIMQFIWTWGSFLVPLVLTYNKPDLRTLAVGMQSFVGTYTSDLAGLAAAACMSLIPVVVVFAIMQRHFIEGISGSVKS